MNFRSKTARLFKYMDRGKIMFGNFTLLVSIITALGVYKDTAIGRFIFANSEFTIPAIVVIFLCVLIGIGWVEYRFKIIEKQISIDNENNPMLKEILERLKEIEKNQ